jgi:hypothetical protein
VLLSRGEQPIAIAQLRPVAKEPLAPLSLDEARKLCAARSQIAPMASGDEALRELEYPLQGGEGKVKVLLRVRAGSSGARMLVSSSLVGVAPASVLAGRDAGATLEMAVQVFPDAEAKPPDVLYVDGVREPPHFEKPMQRRARSWSLESSAGLRAGGFRAALARSASADWLVQSSAGGVLLTSKLAADPHDARQPGSFVLYLGAAGDESLPEVSPVKLDKLETPARDFVEGSVRVYASGANPFMLSETAVVAEIACPPKATGEVPIKRLPCFFWEAPVVPASVPAGGVQAMAGTEAGTTTPAEGEFRFRFAPPAEGVYGVRIAVVAATGQVRGDAISFAAGPPVSRGFVKARPGERYLRTDDGTPFVPAGVEIPLGEKRLDPEALRTAFVALARERLNAVRLSFSFATFPLESSVGRFDPDVAEALDQVLLSAQARDLHLLLALEDSADISTRSAQHPYFRERNGPLSATPEFFRDVAAKRYFYNRLTYIAARYSAFRSVLGWELMSGLDRSWPILQKTPDDPKLAPEEADLCRRARRDVQSWAAEMALHLKGMDQHEHPVSVSVCLNPAKPWTDLEKLEDLSWVLYAPEIGASVNNESELVHGWAAAARQTGRAAKPLLLTFSTQKPGQVSSHNFCFSALASGCAGAISLLEGKGPLLPDAPAAAVFASALEEILRAQGKEPLRTIDDKADAGGKPIRVLGQAGRCGMIIWVKDATGTPNVPLIKNCELKLPGLVAGKYTLAWLDTSSGQLRDVQTWTAPLPKSGLLVEPITLKVPEFRGDIGLILVPADSQQRK